MSGGVRKIVDYAASLDCIHCGLCLNTCPTYRITGVESSSPRGRIHMMRAVAEERLEPDAEYRDEMDFCLVCRHCESVCPAGVRFSSMMEVARDALPRGPLERLARWLGFAVLLPSRPALRAFFAAGRLAQALGLVRLAGRVVPGLRGLPPLPPRSEARPLPARTPARGEERAVVALLEGCVQPELFGRVNRATARALAAEGTTCVVPRGMTCCGSLHAHNGELDLARRLGRRMIEAFEEVRGPDGELAPVVVNSAGCGSHMRELGHLFEDDPAWADRARRFAARVVDLSEVLAAQPPPAPGALSFRRTGWEGPVAWDDPCHLCHGQGVRRPPREVLERVEGLERVELPSSEACCGSAGLYSLLRPAASSAVFAEKLAALESTGARTLVTANPGCQLQWTAGLRAAGSTVRVVHLAELVDAARADASGASETPAG